MNYKIDYSAQARTNPVFLTAKTAICLMARAGISDVDSIVRCLELEDNHPLRSMADSDTICKNFKHFKSKFLLR